MNPVKKFRSNPWPIAITAYFIVFISFTVGLVLYVSHQKMDLVRGDYYDDEIRYQAQLDRMNRTRELKEPVAITYDQARGAITVSLPPTPAAQSISGNIRLYRPADETLDRDIKLAPNTAGNQDVDATTLRPGLWEVRVYWTVEGHDYYFNQTVVVGAKSS